MTKVESKTGMTRLLIYMLLITSVIFGTLAQAQTDVALRTRIVNEGVTILLGGTQGGRTLREDASFPLTAGDILTTDRSGRALLEFGTGVEILVLPNSTVTVLANQQVENRWSLRLALEGQTVQRVRLDDAASYTLEIELPTGIAQSSGGWYAVWTVLEGRSVITLQNGALTFVQGADVTPLERAQGLLATETGVSVETFDDAPYNGAALIAQLEGCDAQVTAPGGALNVRAGTSVGYAVIGDLNTGTIVRLMGRTVDGNWLRVQRFSGFGWALASGITTECELPVYPNLSGEANLEMTFVEAIEVELMTPFYGTFESNPWLYRWLE
jgi:hypothetical protein